MFVRNYGIIEKANKLADGEVEVIVNSGEWDSYGERINIDGVDFKSYMKNPVVLWAHDSFNLPIGKATKVWKESGNLMARVKFYLRDDFPRKIYQYILDGVLGAVSIGGNVIEWAEDGKTIDKLKMKEFSVVTLPADENALVVNKMASDQISEINGLARAYARKMLAKDESDIIRNIETLESLIAALKEVAISQPHEEQAITRVMLRQAQAVDHQAEKTIRSIKLKKEI